MKFLDGRKFSNLREENFELDGSLSIRQFLRDLSRFEVKIYIRSMWIKGPPKFFPELFYKIFKMHEIFLLIIILQVVKF